MKHLVVSGCSLTISDGVKIGNKNRSWSWALYEHFKISNPSLKFHNVGLSGGGNYLIAMSCIDTVQCLLKSGVDPEDIFVLTQWSGLFRPALYTENLKQHRKIDFHEMNTEYTSLKNANLDKGFFVDTAGQFRRNNPFWLKYLGEYTCTSSAFIDTLDNMTKLQWYLKANNINYRMFNGWDIFTVFDKNSERFGSDIVINKNQFGDHVYNNTKNTLIKDTCSMSQGLWEQIDWRYFWTFKNKNVKFGGMTQWIQNNIGKKFWYVAPPRDVHPPSETAKIFCNKVIIPLMEKRCD